MAHISRSASPLLRRITLTLAAILVYRLGCAILLPGTDLTLLTNLSAGESIALWSLFSGGPLTRASVFALGITPFITASIVMQLLDTSIPALRRMRRDGVVGQQRRNRITKTLAIAVAAIQAPLSVHSLSRGNTFTPAVLPDNMLTTLLAIVLVFTGFLASIWLAEMISKHGIGNGATILLLTSIAATAAPGFRYLFTQMSILTTLTLSLVLIFLVSVLIVAQLSSVVISITSARPGVMVTPERAKLKLKLIGGGATPYIFAATIMTVVTSLFGQLAPELAAILSNQQSLFAITIMWLLCVGFSRLWARSAQDPVEMANDFQRNGYFLSGIKPGWETAQRLHNVTVIPALLSSLFLLPVVATPFLLGKMEALPLLSVVGVSLVLFTSSTVELRRQIRELGLLHANPAWHIAESDLTRIVSNARSAANNSRDNA